MNCYGYVKWTNPLGESRLHVVKGYYEYDCRSIAHKYIERKTKECAPFRTPPVFEYFYLGEDAE